MSYLGVSILFRNAELPLLKRIGFIVFLQQAANQPLHQDKACRCPSSSQFISRFSTAGNIKQHN
jgi:hypothetical protein